MEQELPLKGIRVVDISMYIAGPLSGRMMAEWGADVVKVEPPSGDLWRRNGPLAHMPTDDDFNPVYQVGNQCKEHIAINLKDPKGREVLLRLLEDADIFITNFRTKALEKMGLSYEQLSERFPRLVYAYMSGYGDKGPDSDKPGYDTTAFWARSGLLGDLSQKDQAPINGPGAVGDAITATFFVSGILSALVRQQRTGQGCMVSTSLFTSALWAASIPVIGAQERFGDPWPRSWERDPISPSINMYPCSDGEWIFLAVVDVLNRWNDLSRVLGRTEWIDNPTYTQGYILSHKVEIISAIKERMLGKTCKEWEQIFAENDIPFQTVRHFKDQMTDEQAWANGYLYEQKYHNGETCFMVNNPIHFSDFERTEYPPVGHIGENTLEIMKRYRYTQEEIDALLDGKVIRAYEAGKK